MDEEDFNSILPAVWLVFGGSYLTHANAPGQTPDKREQSLVKLLSSYLTRELSKPEAQELYGLALTQLADIYELLKLWSEDLDLIYEARAVKNHNQYVAVKQLAQRFLQRIRSCNNCTIIPSGLISLYHALGGLKSIEGRHEHVSVAIVKREPNNCIDWVQVNPGSDYHQRCPSLVGVKSNPFLEITEINPDNITEDLLYLLVGLRVILPSAGIYEESSIYECLLSHLNGQTVCRLSPDEDFMACKNTFDVSPVHTWEVISQAFRYLVRHFLGDAYHDVYHRLLTGFKLFLMKETFAIYQENQTQGCHFFLQEMCRDVAQQALDHGSEEQKAVSLELIDKVKAATEEYCSQNELKLRQRSQLGEADISSLSFVAPHLTKRSLPSSGPAASSLKVDPVFVKPNPQDDIIDYLRQFKRTFIDALVNSDNLNEIALLSYGIEVFLIDYLAKTDILKISIRSPFSRSDIYLANTLKELAECYYGCQAKLVNHFLSYLTYQPHIYAKNVIVQFFIYAAIAALNFRDERIGPVLATHNLSVDISDSVSLIKIIPHLIIKDATWLNVLLSLREFFMPEKEKRTLFSYNKFEGSQFTYKIGNFAEESDIDIAFAFELLDEYPEALSRFITDHRHLDEEKLNRKWQTLAYTDNYLPVIYGVLSKVAHFAKVSLRGFSFGKGWIPSKIGWHFINSKRSYWKSEERREYFNSKVSFQVDSCNVKTNVSPYTLTSYLVNSGPRSDRERYQRLVNCDSGSDKPRCHLQENMILASQDKKPKTTDRLRYMHLGFLQSEHLLKIERLYIALKQQQLDFNSEQESLLIKQTLFEVSVLIKDDDTVCSSLEWTISHNPLLIHKLGLLCIEKARAKQYCLTQHHSIGNILEAILDLLTFYPLEYKDEFVRGIADIYYLLKDVLMEPPSNLSDPTLLHLYAYLIICVQAKPQLVETELLMVLKALLSITTYNAKGVQLDNIMLLRVYKASFALSEWMEHILTQDPTPLNELISSVLPQWDEDSSWQKGQTGFLFTCGDHAIKPLLGSIYFKNQPVVGLPHTITDNSIFKEYLGRVSFAVIPGTQKINSHDVPCYLSVDSAQQMRLTLIEDTLFIEELIENNYHRYIPAQELLGLHDYPSFLYNSPYSGEKLRHWLDRKKILIKDKNRQIIYEWDLSRNFLFSVQHEGYVVPWDELQKSDFKTWLQRIESSLWIEIIAQLTSDQWIQIQSLHFPRLGLHFDIREGNFWCKQVHGYVLAEQQHINTLHGFLNYLILEKKEPNSTHKLTKVIIPHRKIALDGSFIAKTAYANHETVLSPAYFVYDFDRKTGLLKGHHTRANLYLALLYYATASVDDHDTSSVNGYHLAKENLEVCWKDQPFDEVELGVIEQFLGPTLMRDLNINRINLYLKMVALLSSSLGLSFLYTEEIVCKNTERSHKLLDKCSEYLPFLLVLYLQNKSTIFAQIRLSLKEEKDVIKRCLSTFKTLSNEEELKKFWFSSFMQTLEAYYQLNFNQQPQLDVSMKAKKCYNSHYAQLFSEQALRRTNFLHDFKKLANLSLSYDMKEINLLSGFDGILLERFRLNCFITLYKLAKSSHITISKYCYMLHYLVFRAQANYDRLSVELTMMFARALLLVAEHPRLFPEVPYWFGVDRELVEISKRYLKQNELLASLPAFIWNRERDYDTWEEEQRARLKAQTEDENKNKRIWSSLLEHDLDSSGTPRRLPRDPNNFTLVYESHINFRDARKQDVVRRRYLEAAYNDSMYQFFVRVLTLCDNLKYESSMGWSINPFTNDRIDVTITPEKSTSPTRQPVSLEKWAFSQEPLIDLNEFFVVVPKKFQNTKFLFEAQLETPDNEYQRKFYSELQDSWFTYHNESEHSYSWLNDQSLNELEHVLQTKYDMISKQAEETWSLVATQLKQRPNSESDNYFALRWYSGQVPHYHKGDILRLLVEPHKLANYNPCVEKFDSIIQSLLSYVNCEINIAKIVRVLAFVEQYKQTESEEEQYSVLHILVRSLQENVDPASFRYPHWFLFQLENEIIVRENQRELIEDMLNQTEKAMYQLNMGEGKSSVILPLLSNNLANGQQILRINVLSALLITMKNFLRQRFSGLIKKRIYTLPFHRDSNISPEFLKLILQAVQTCQHDQHILLVTPEHRLCLQLKVRELMLENQQQIGATDIFDWQTYRQRVLPDTEAYNDLPESEVEKLLERQDEYLRTCLRKENFIDSRNKILKVPPRGQGRTEFARFKDSAKDTTFREWSCLKAAYRELLYNSTLAYEDSKQKLTLLNEINALPAIDLLDESDEILRHGTELNYTLGDRHMYAGGELRWQIPQFFIKAIFCDPELKKVIAEGKAGGYTVLNLQFSPQGGVPFIQLLDESYFENAIKPILIKKFFLENAPTLLKYQLSENTPLVNDEVSSLKEYIAGQLPQKTERKIMAFLADKTSLKDKILIAKGWLSHGILFHVFNAKYRVQYGLNLASGQRTKAIAIPFMGKDAPSPRSEFSHPDVVLGFTIISYLYQGLNQAQLKETLMRLKNKFCHQVAEMHLLSWAKAGRAWIETQTDSFPPLMLTSLNNLDLSDEQCLEKVHQYLSGNHLAILFYLNQFILLKEAMQYLFKISANAHSLVGYDAALGFSGTDDRKLTMPFQVKSLRSATQEGTNGKLLSVLSQERNTSYYSLQVESTNNFLIEICHYVAEQPHCHALIDAGALVTGLSNFEAASFILRNLPPRFLGVLYFSDEGNTLSVLTRDNKTIALQDCYLDKQCLFAYLDDIHTRGTDIKLPLNCHAILTVSQGMEKDKLMQAAMRLRQLAEKQSVSLWGTEATTLAIARDNSINASAINSLEVIKWVTKNTIEHINTDLFPVAMRKINFQFLRKSEAWLKMAPTTLDSLIQHCREKELFTLEEFYALTPQRQDLADRLYFLVAGRIRVFWQEIEEELQSKQLTHNTAFHQNVFDQAEKNKFRQMIDTIVREIAPYLQMGLVHCSLDNDEEKEVEVEIIQEQEVLINVEKRDARAERTWEIQLIPREDFILVAEQATIIVPLNAIRKLVQMPANLKNVLWHPDIYMTYNFIHSVTKSKPSETLDNYLRPVDVLLLLRREDGTKVILVSGHEASRIKSKCIEVLDEDNVMVHLHDVNGPSQLPIDSVVTEQEQKLLTIVKLFSGECHYSSLEVEYLAKRIGRLFPDYFDSPATDGQELYKNLIKEGYLDFCGIMTHKLLRILDLAKSGGAPPVELVNIFQAYRNRDNLCRRLRKLYSKLIIEPNSLRENHNILWQWVGTRGRLKEYVGSDLEGILNSENLPNRD